MIRCDDISLSQVPEEAFSIPLLHASESFGCIKELVAYRP
jgi:hypothetical protein